MSFQISVNNLITYALKTVRLQTPFQAPRPEYITDCLQLLNELLAEFNANNLMIPYQTDLSFNVEPNVATYRIAPTGAPPAGAIFVTSQPFIEVNYVDVFFNNIQYPIRIITDKNALDVFRATNITTIPESVRVHQLVAPDTNLPATDLIFFCPPNQEYLCTIRGKAKLLNVTLNTNITGLPDYYFRFLRLWVAREITTLYPTNGWTDELEMRLKKAQDVVRGSSDQDLWVRAPGYLTKKDLYYYNTYLGVRLG